MRLMWKSPTLRGFVARRSVDRRVLHRFGATVFPFERPPLHVLAKPKEGSHDKRDYGCSAKHEKAEPIELDKPKRLVGFKATT
ncbi:hypothetical protein [Propionivibrio sp.]|uniref:hypothetical protein n=1 Tax=Propionivibrio sp. TaxID=2212460 RepID=UPI0039E465D3